jgi:hypothetical protein
MAEFQLGSISTGTLRQQDLLSAFAQKLSSLESTKFYAEVGPDSLELYHGSELVQQAPAMLNALDNTTAVGNPYVAEYLDWLTDALQEYCPPFVYFGAHPGDGADFGFWPDMDSLNEALQPGRKFAEYQRADMPFPKGESILPGDGVIVHVSDHGNVTVMDMERNVLWSVV